MSKPEREYYTKIHLKDSYDVLTVTVSATSKREAIRLIQEKYPNLELMYFKPRRVASNGGKSSNDVGLWTVIRWYLLPDWRPLGVTIIAIIVVMWLIPMCSGGG
ncbi:MAG: hypothetical protein F4X44_11965 [Gammaproteobacteria bacterium]|nr:hypothetical protein [Gammaproteobacteria bacterium]MYD81313.1 hypothetical protein [Gammaproteobacteria bacterium]